jgi:hypothetical protein
MFDPKRPHQVYGIELKHESIAPDKTGTLGPEASKGKKHVARAKAILGAAVSNPAEDVDKKKRSKSGKDFLRKI